MILEKGGVPDQEYKGDRSYKEMLKFCQQHLFTRKTKKIKSKKNHIKKGGKSKKKKKARKSGKK